MLIHWRFLSLTLGLFLGLEVVTAQVEQSAKQRPAQPAFTLRVSAADLLTVSLKAENAPLQQIAQDLSKRLEIPVLVGASLKQSVATADFEDLLLEPSLNQLAPSVYIDYEVNTGPGKQPRAIGIYLYGHDDPPPNINEVVKGKSEAFFIEGHTEDFGNSNEDDALRVRYKDGYLTVRAKRQPLLAVLHSIASELGIPFEMNEEIVEVVDVNITRIPLEEAFELISANVRLYVRADLHRNDRRPFRLVLINPQPSS